MSAQVNGRAPKSLQEWASFDNIEAVYKMWRPDSKLPDLQVAVCSAWQALWQSLPPGTGVREKKVWLSLGKSMSLLHDGGELDSMQVESAFADCVDTSPTLSNRHISLKDGCLGSTAPDLEIHALAHGWKHLAAVMECRVANLGNLDDGRSVPASPHAVRAAYLDGIAQLMLNGGEAWSFCGTAMGGLCVNNGFWRITIVSSSDVSASAGVPATEGDTESGLPVFLIEVADDSGLAGSLISPSHLLDESLAAAAIPPNAFPEYRSDDQEMPPVTPDSALGRLYDLMILGGLVGQKCLASGPGRCAGGPRVADVLSGLVRACLDTAVANGAGREMLGKAQASEYDAGSDVTGSATSDSDDDDDEAVDTRSKPAGLEAMGCKIILVDSARMDSIYRSLRAVLAA